MKEIEILNEILKELNLIKKKYTQITYYYVYVTFFSNGNFYIGSRQCTCNPEEDINYIGSYANKNNFNGKKFILEVFSNENKMIFYETELIQKFKSHSNCINISSSPRVCNNKLQDGVFSTQDLMKIYGCSSSTTVSNWCLIAEITRVREGKSFIITYKDKEKLDELSNFIKSGYTYVKYLKSKGKTDEEIQPIISKVKGLF